MIRERDRESSDARCVQVIDDATRFAENERSTGNSRQDRSSPEAWQLAELDALQRKAAGARDPEMLLAALLLPPRGDGNAHDAEKQTMLLDFGTGAVGSGSPLLAWHALRACAEAGDACPYAHLEQDLLDMQRQNAEAWGLVATLRYQRRDIAGALAAMQGAARASTSTWHWSETVELLERVVATHTAVTFPDSAVAAFGSAAAIAIPGLSDLNTMCRAESASSRAWGEACLAFGTLRQDHHDSELAQGVAYSVRRQALTDLGEREGAEEILTGYERFSTESLAGGSELVVAGARLADALISTRRENLLDYLKSVRQSGEIAARREFLRREVPSLLERAGLLGREGARECAAELFLEPRSVGETRQDLLEYRLQNGDELRFSLRDSRTGTRSSTYMARRVGPDGKIHLIRGISVAAASITTEQLQRDLAAAISTGTQPREVLVIPIPRRSGEELRSAFEAARSGPRATAR